MPLYEFQCDKCGHRFEKRVARIGEGVDSCPECGAAAPKRLLSAFAVTSSSSSVPETCGSGACCPTGTCPFEN